MEMKNPKRQMSHPPKRHSSTKLCRRDRKRKAYAFPSSVDSPEVFEEKKSLEIKAADCVIDKARSKLHNLDHQRENAIQRVSLTDLNFDQSWSKFRKRMRDKGFAF